MQINVKGCNVLGYYHLQTSKFEGSKYFHKRLPFCPWWGRGGLPVEVGWGGGEGGKSASGGVGQTPQNWEKRAVHILLEYFLVIS